VQLEARIATIRMAETFVISRGAQDEAEVVDVEIRHDGVSGFGEAAPIERYSESAQSALAFLESSGDALGDDPFAFEEIEARLRERPGELAAKAAIDAALHDLCGKLVGLPAWRLLGLRRAGPPTSWTIWLGSPDEMAERAERVQGRFKRLKLKLGAGDGQDVERVRAVRGVTEVPLQVDVNEAWSLDEALEALPELARLGVQYCEQPLPAGDPDGPELKRRSPLPIYVDEDCHILADVPACAERAHGLTVKLAKSGGIREAVRMAHAGRALGLGLMLGCMNESGLAVAAGAACASLFDHVDLDGNLLLAHDPWPGVELVDGVQLPADAPGLGARRVPEA
jgi:L-alanine-DL-glutamate epimerase-like enolase superfamily enzyme